MTNKELEQLFKLCRKYGIKRFKSADVELDYNDELPTKSNEGPTDLKTEPTYSDEELLMWSTGN